MQHNDMIAYSGAKSEILIHLFVASSYITIENLLHVARRHLNAPRAVWGAWG